MSLLQVSPEPLFLPLFGVFFESLSNSPLACVITLVRMCEVCGSAGHHTCCSLAGIFKHPFIIIPASSLCSPPSPS